MDDSGAHVVLRVRVNVLKKLHGKKRVKSLLFGTPLQCHPFFSILRDVWIQTQRAELQNSIKKEKAEHTKKFSFLTNTNIFDKKHKIWTLNKIRVLF